MSGALGEHAGLVAQLERARALGFLGPGPVEPHIEHAAVFLQALEEVHGTVVDLGSGGGVPGFVIGVARPDLHLVLLDARAKRCELLRDGIQALQLDAEVCEGRAELIGHSSLRGAADAVVARSFGPSAATAECGSALLRVGGRLVVSEPPAGQPVAAERWPSEGLGKLGMVAGPRIGAGPSVQVLIQASPCPEQLPRRDGLPAQRPLF